MFIVRRLHNARYHVIRILVMNSYELSVAIPAWSDEVLPARVSGRDIIGPHANDDIDALGVVYFLPIGH